MENEWNIGHPENSREVLIQLEDGRMRVASYINPFGWTGVGFSYKHVISWTELPKKYEKESTNEQ